MLSGRRRQVVTQALARGAQVRALARHPDGVEFDSNRVEVAASDVLDRAALTERLSGCDAVVSTVGVGTSRDATQVYSLGVANMLSAMGRHGIRRLAVISAAPVGPRPQQPLLQRRVVMPILDRFFGATYADMRAMEAVLVGSDLDWTCLRPPRLVDRTALGRYRIDAAGPLPKTRSLTFGTSPPRCWTALTASTSTADPPTSPTHARPRPSAVPTGH